MIEKTRKNADETTAYFASRQRGNTYILLGLLAFIGIVIAVTMWTWDTQEFLDVTRAEDAYRAQIDAQRETYLNVINRQAEARAQ